MGIRVSSRKQFLGVLTAASDAGHGSVPHHDGNVRATPVDDRREGSVAVAAWAYSRGVGMVRAHDVRATVRAARVVA